MFGITHFLFIAALLFGIGVTGVLISRNIIVMLMSVELMLNAANLAIIAFSRAQNIMDGHAFVFLVLTVAAAEAAVGLAMVITIYNNRRSINIDKYSLLKW